MARPRKVGYGEGSLYQETDGRWRGELRFGPKRRRVSGETRTEALKKLDELRAQHDAGLPIGGDTRLGAWLDWYLDNVVVEKSPNTLANYTWAVQHLQPLAGQRLRDLEVGDVESLLKNLATGEPQASPKKGRGGRRKPLGKSSLIRIRTVLGAALYEAQRLDMLSRNVAHLARIPKEAASPRKRRSLKSGEARDLLSAIKGQRHEALLLLHLTLGLRPGEITGLPWSALNLQAGTVEIRQSLKRLPDGSLEIGGTKVDSDRTLRLSPDVITALRRHQQIQRKERIASPVWEDHGLVFPNAIGRPIDPSNLRRIVKDATDAAGIGHLSPNELRHSATSLLVDAGTPIQDVSDMLGHNSIRMLSQVYRHKVRHIVDVTAGQDRMFLGPQGEVS